jgi:hypothetical protein
MIVFFLLTINLSQIPFWDDEAMVSWFARNANGQFILKSFDGNNPFFYRNGTLFNYINPPLDIFYLSWIQKYIGDTIWIQRFSFVFLGFVSCFLFLMYLHNTLKDKNWRLLSFIAYSLNINFILYSRNCRYYALVYFFGSLLLYLSSLQIYKKNAIKSLVISILFSLGFVGLYLSHYLQAIIWIFIIFYILIQQGRIKNFTNKYFVSSFTLSLLLCIMYSLYFHIFNRNDLINSDNLFLKNLKLTVWLINDFNRYMIFPIWFFLILILSLFIKRLKTILLSDNIKLFLKSFLVFVLLSILLSPQDTSNSGSFDMRYLQVGLPLFAIITGYYLHLIFYKIKNLLLFVCFLIIFFGTSFFFYIPYSTPLRGTLLGFIHEKFSSEYETPLSCLKKYLDKNLRKKTKITCIPDYNNTFLMYYYPSQSIITSVIDSNKYINDSLIKKMNLSHTYKGNQPEIVILFGDKNRKTGEEMNKIDFGNYSIIDSINIKATDLEYSRPEMAWHLFQKPKLNQENRESIYILKNRNL